jgi:branched-chain amino acid transport system permease protein
VATATTAPVPVDVAPLPEFPAAPPSGGGGPNQVIDRPDVQRAALLAGGACVFYFVQQVLWPAPFGVLVQGMVIGGLTALIAFGISLIYRANRIINFAAGDLGGAPASLAVLLVVGPQVPYVVALPLGLLFGLVLGMLVEVLIIRRFFKAPRLLMTAATIFIAQLLTFLSLSLPRFFHLTTPPQSFPSPFDFSFEISPIVFRGNDIVAMLAVPIVILSLILFFRYTAIGIAVRASAESADRAALLGVPVKRIQTIVWVIATLLSTLAIFLRAGIVGLPIGSVLGPTILIRALAACVIGRMERLPTIFFAAVGLGIIEQVIIWDTGRSIITAPIIFVIILGALLFQRKGIAARADDTSTWQAAKEVRPIPDELAGFPEVKYGFKAVIAIIAVFFALLPMVLPESRVNLAGVILIYALVGVSLVVLTGWAGQVSLGQVAFMGIGAAVGGAVTSRLHWDLGFALLLSGLAGAFVAVVIGLPALRIKGLFLAIITLAFGAATSTYLLSNEFFSWWLPQGRIVRTPLFGLIAIDSETRFYYLTLGSLALAIYGVSALRQSRTGRVLIGVRENERNAQAFGVNATSAKLTAFAVSGFVAAFAGGLFVHHQQGLGISPYSVEQSLVVFVMVVIGGLGSVSGALIGAAFVVGTSYFVPELKFFVTGAGALLTLMVLPGGVGGLVYQGRDGILRRVAARRKVLVPSLVADARELSSIVSATDKGREILRQMADQLDASRAGAAGAFDLTGNTGPDLQATEMASPVAVPPVDSEDEEEEGRRLPRRRRVTTGGGGR